MKALSFIFILSTLSASNLAQTRFVVQPDRVFDGDQMHEGWIVGVQGNKIVPVGTSTEVKKSVKATVLTFRGCTCLPGMIGGHSHLLLHGDVGVFPHGDNVR